MTSKQPGRTRQKLAKLLQENFPVSAGGLALTWEASDLHPATGAYRTNVMLDTWRWEGYARHYRPDGSHWMVLSVGSYTPMTELIKSKHLAISRDGEVSALEEVNGG